MSTSIGALNARSFRLEIAAVYASSRATLASARYQRAAYGYSTHGSLELIAADRAYIRTLRQYARHWSKLFPTLADRCADEAAQ